MKNRGFLEPNDKPKDNDTTKLNNSYYVSIIRCSVEKKSSKWTQWNALPIVVIKYLKIYLFYKWLNKYKVDLEWLDDHLGTIIVFIFIGNGITVQSGYT